MNNKLLSAFLVAFIACAALAALPAYAGVKQDGGVWIVDDAEGFAAVKDGNKNAAREEAMSMAYRDALEKALGAVVTGVTEMENYQVVRDKVFSQTQGIVKKFDVLSEKIDEDGMLTLVGLCHVATAALDGVLGPAVLDAIGNPRVMVLVDERIGDQTPFLSTAEGVVLSVFEKAGYLLVDPDQARALLNIDPASAYNDPTQLMDAARTLNADVIILGRAYGSAFTPGPITVPNTRQKLWGVKSTVQLKAVLTKTAYQLGSQTVEKNTKGQSVEQGVITGLQQATPEAAGSIVHKIAYALVSGSASGVPGMTVKARITGVSFAQSEAILEALRELAGNGGGVYDRGLTGGLFEVDVVSERSVRTVASFLSENGVAVSGIDGQIISGAVSAAPAGASAPEPEPFLTVVISAVPSFKEAGAIEEALRGMIGQGEIEAEYKDKVLTLKVVSGKTGREVASFLSENGIEITGSTAQSVEGMVIGDKKPGLW